MGVPGMELDSVRGHWDADGALEPAPLRTRSAGRRTAVLHDSQPLTIAALERVVASAEIDVVATAVTPSAALAALEQHAPDLFVTSVETPERASDSFTCIRRARELVDDLRIVILSAQPTTEEVDAALEAGADVYVAKTVEPEEIAWAIKQTFDPTTYIRQRETSRPAQRRTTAIYAPSLTRRESEVLRLVAEGYSNARLAKMLWVTEQTVKFHLSNIYRKLDVRNRTEASRWAQLNGMLSRASASASDTAG